MTAERRREPGGLQASQCGVLEHCTHLARALKEWLKDLAAKWSRVCRNTSIFSGLKPSPSSRKREDLDLGKQQLKSASLLYLCSRSRRNRTTDMPKEPEDKLLATKQYRYRTIVVLLVGIGNFLQDGENLLIWCPVFDCIWYRCRHSITRQRSCNTNNSLKVFLPSIF